MSAPRRTRSRFGALLLVVVGAALTVLPLLWMLAASFSSPGVTEQRALPLLGEAPTLEHYRTLFARLDAGRAALNSLLVASSVTILSLLLNSLAGYAFARLRFRGRDALFRLLLAGMIIPGQVAMLPLFLMLKQIGLVNTYAGVVVPGMASVFGIFLVRQYVLSIPETLLDAARIDGAGEWRIYWSIVLPLCTPLLATLAVFSFLGAWNDFLWPLIVLSDAELYTLPVALANLLGEHAQDAELMMAGAVVTIVPVVVVFLALQRYYVAGILQGGLKG
jgi:multiple sugar transport system permease protein